MNEFDSLIYETKNKWNEDLIEYLKDNKVIFNYNISLKLILIQKVTFSRIFKASILLSTSCIFIYTWFNLIPVLLSIRGPAFLIRNSALLYSCRTYTGWRTRLKKEVIESAMFIKLWCKAILPASANLSKMIGANLFV